MSQSQIASFVKDLGVKGATRQSQALYEKGEQSPSAAYLSAISTAGADVLYILTGQHAVLPSATSPAERAAVVIQGMELTESDAAMLVAMAKRLSVD